MNGMNAFGLVNLGGAFLSIGDVSLTDLSGEAEASLLSSEVPVYHYLDLEDVFLQSGRPRLEVLRRALENHLMPKPDSYPKSLDELKRMFGDLCRDDLCGLERRSPMAKLQFAGPDMAKREAERLLNGDGSPQERLSRLIAMAGNFGSAEGAGVQPSEGEKKREQLVLRRISHLMAGHREVVLPEHVQALLQLGLLKLIVGTVNDWSVGDTIKVLGELIQRGHVEPLIALAKRDNKEARVILRGLFGTWGGICHHENHPTFSLFTGDDLWELFDLMQREPLTQRSWGSFTEGVKLLALCRPAIFTADHVAWLETLAPFQDHEDSIHGTVNEYERILESLREKRPNLFPKRGLWGGRKKSKSLAQAQLAAELIRRTATARELVHVDTEEMRAGGGADISS